MKYTDYYIPANFTDAGKLMGLFPIRNTIEALVLSAPLMVLCFSMLPLSVSTNLMITLIVVVPVGGFALIGIQDESLTQFLAAWWRWRTRRGIMTYRGTVK